jgi:hypothetical protein
MRIGKGWLFLLLPLVAFQTGGDFRFSFGIPFPTARFMTTDAIGNIYVIADNQLLKFSSDGKPLQNYAELRNGELRMVDATNPMKVLLFYPDMARLVALGTQFAPQSTIELRNLGIYQPTLACNSANEGYWIYDLQDFQLKKLDLNLQLVFQSGNLQLLTGKKVVPTGLMEFNQRVYLNDPTNGILVFDQFAGYYKTLQVQGIKSIQGVKDRLYCNDGENVFSYDVRRGDYDTVPLPLHRQIKTARFSDNRLYLLTTDSLNTYSF